MGADAILIKGPEKGNNKESGRKGFIDQGQCFGTAIHMRYKCFTSALEILLFFFNLYEVPLFFTNNLLVFFDCEGLGTALHPRHKYVTDWVNVR